MSSYVEELLESRLSGIQAKYWLSFLKAFVDGATEEAINGALAKVRVALRGEADSEDAALRAVTAITELIEQRVKPQE